MQFVVLITFLVSFITTLILIPLVRKISLAIDFVDMPGERKVHQYPISLGGGIAIFLSIIITFSSALIVSYLLKVNQPKWLPQEIYDYLPGVFVMIPKLSVIFIGASAIFILGLFDDIKKLSAFTKLFFQIIVSIFVVANGIKFGLFLEHFGTWGQIISATLTIFWIVLVTNSFNLLDHMDGLSAGISAITASVFLIIALKTGQYFIASFLIAIIGSVIAFLIFNFHPAKIFMGDAGSLLLGYFISILTVLFTFYREPHQYYAILTPLLVVSIPIFDTIVVVIIRIVNKKPIFRGDKNHLAHRLIALGMKIPHAVLLIYLLTICAGLSAILLYYLTPDKQANITGAILIFGQIFLLLCIVTILEYSGRKNKNAD
ncbi:MAG: MraY family glycosyltransferase [Planctomycetota bacterium]|nr:MraY family glycosyltransferase [Planctomycetota bacterium]MDI6787124.1 MraY family glycosyltransferase [Planctomycetota bacterium]